MDSILLYSFASFAESLATLVARAVSLCWPRVMSLAGMAQDAAELLPSVSGWTVHLVKDRCSEAGRDPLCILCYSATGLQALRQGVDQEQIKPCRPNVEVR